jgi:DNA-directed RNA polymerase subunit RPC12/RpoP
MAGHVDCKESDQVQDKRGLECRYCGCKHFRVIYTRRGWGGKLIRRRECRHCGNRMTTWERPIGG